MNEINDIIYTYGGGQALYKILEGIAMIYNSDLAKHLLKMMTVIAVSWAAIQGIMQNSFVPKVNWAIKYMLITTLIIAPKANVAVTDVVTRDRYIVNNLPIGLVLPASLISTIGYGITQTFELAFSAVDDLAYSKYGTAFGASLISQARNFKIQDGVFRENIESFIDNCVLYDVMIGNKYTIGDLRSSTDIWQTVTEKASNIKMFNYREKGKFRKLVTCREGAAFLNNNWNDDLSKLATRFSTTIFGRYGTNKPGTNNSNAQSNQFMDKVLINNLDIVTQSYGGKGQTGVNNLKQLMMINAMADLPASYGAIRAKHQQYETWQITGQLARDNLPLMHAVFAGLIYASFILIMGLMVLPGGFKVFSSYVGLLLWIELWPPLFAVLNLIVNLSAKASGGHIAGGFTMDNISQIVSTQGNISALAGFLMASIPFISYAIIRGGAGQFVHLARILHEIFHSGYFSRIFSKN